MSKNTKEYFFTYETNVKERWKNRTIIDVMEAEFKTRPREYFIGAVESGVITINNQRISPNRKLGMQDVIQHTVHMHEPEPPEINIIAEEEDYTVVNKPAGVPCHPTGGYIYYSVTKKLFPDVKVACVNRLDMPVSGVLILTTNNHSKWLSEIKNACKIYVAKVKGKFPDELEVNKPIICVEGRKRYVDENGKECQTFFRRLEYKNGYSLVECRPITGRTHQLRIHLMSVGFPIINDVIYGDGSPIFNQKTNGCNVDISEFEDKEKYEYIKNNCKGENSRSFKIKDYHICLHSWKYKYNNKEYVAELPTWCEL